VRNVATADPVEVTRRFFESYGRGDLAASADCLAQDLIASVTNAESGADTVVGREAYMRRVPDLAAAGGSIAITQILPIDSESTLSMVEIRARRRGRDLHNFAGFLARVVDGRISHLWMVDARPEYSDEFWS
jgi:ketosteroid isomerase-like protein